MEERIRKETYRDPLELLLLKLSREYRGSEDLSERLQKLYQVRKMIERESSREIDKYRERREAGEREGGREQAGMFGAGMFWEGVSERASESERARGEAGRQAFR